MKAMDDEYERYQKQMAYYHSKLTQISDRTAKLAEWKLADARNPEFRQLMVTFDQLIKQADELTERMLGHKGP